MPSTISPVMGGLDSAQMRNGSLCFKPCKPCKPCRCSRALALSQKIHWCTQMKMGYV